MKNFVLSGSRRLKAVLSLIIAAALIVGTLNFGNVTAKAGSDPVGTPASTGIVGYATLDDNGGFRVIGTEDSDAVVTADGITASKTIAASANGGYDVTLKVETSKTVTSNKAAVVLVLDYSSSMDSSAKKAIRDAAKTFINGLKKDAPNTMVAVVAFANRAHTFYSWKEASKYNTDGFNISFSEDPYGRMTNTEAALELASNLLEMDSVKEFGNKNVILFTDGEPTLALDRSKKSFVSNTTDVYSTKEIKETYDTWDGTMYCHTVKIADYAKAVAMTLKNSGTNIYSVYYGDIASEYIYKDAASQKKDKKTGGYTVQEFLDSFSKDTYSTQKTSDFATIFTRALQDIISGSDGKGWKVTDPMGQFITYSSSNAFGLTGGTLTWNLSDTTPATRAGSKPGETIYTYTYTYHIDLDTSAEGFVDGQYPANGRTVLSYDGKTLDLRVPVLEGTAPTYVYSVEYYKKSKTTGNYELDSFKSGPVAAARIHSVKTASDIDSNYANTYENHTFNSSKSTTGITVSAVERNNVIKLYFDPDTVQIPVEINYIDITANRARTPVHQVTTSSTGFKGYAFTYSYTDTRSRGGHQYTFTAAGSVTSIAEVKGDGSDKIVLNYERETREEAIVLLEKNYLEHAFKLVDGRYVSDDKESKSGPDRIESRMSTDSYTLGAYSEEGWTVTEIRFNDAVVEAGSNQTLAAGENLISVKYERTVDWPATAEVEVVYEYEYTEHFVNADGERDSRVQTASVDPVKYSNYRVGETFTAEDKPVYEGKEYVADENNKYSIEVQATGNRIVLNYFGEAEYPETSTVTVNHIYRTLTMRTVVTTGTAVDETTGEVYEIITGTETVPELTTDSAVTVEYPEEDGILYKGQKTAIQIIPNGYTFDDEESDDISDVRANGQTISLYYIKNDKVDDRDDADILITAYYYKDGYKIEDGQVVPFTNVYEGNRSRNDVSVIGSGYTVDSNVLTELATFNGNKYFFTEGDTSIAVVQNGTNVITLKYVRNVGDSELEPATVNVTNVYRTWNMTVQNGVAGYYADGISDVSEDGSFVPAAEKYYEGQKITVDDGATSEFAEADASNPALVKTLAAGENSFTYTYIKRVELPKATVTVTNHYTLNHINEDGSADAPVITESEPETTEKYVGEKFIGSYTLAEGFGPEDLTGIKVDGADAESAEITVSADGSTIDFYFEHTDDDSVSVDYEINHVYFTYDWDNSLLNNSSSQVTGTAFKSNTISVTPDTAGGLYELVEVAAAGVISCDGNAEELKDVTRIEVVLSAEKAVITLSYERYTDTRIPATVIINHHYSAEDTYTSTTTDEGTDVVTMYGTLENGWLGGRVYNGSVFTFSAADERPVYGEKTYTLTAVSPASVTAHDGTPEVIDAYYTRSYSSYVPHNYDIIIVVPSTKFTVTFRDYDETFLGSDTVEKGEAATAPAAPTRAADDNYTYTFAGWDKDFSNVISDMTVYATYTPHEIEVVDIIEDEDVPEGEPEIEVEDEVEPTPEVEPEVEVEEVIDIEEPEVPEADLPKTGTLPVVLFFCAGAACIGFGGFVAVKARKKDEKEA